MNALTQLPKGVLVFLVLLGGLGLIMLAQPPHSVCEPQLEIFHSSQIGFLYLDPKTSYIKTTGFRRSLDFCKSGNSAGSCFEFLEGLKKMVMVVQSAPEACVAELSELPEVSSSVWQGLELLVRVAWGESPPKSSLERQGWLDQSNMEIFCRLKKFATAHYGIGQWSSFVENKLGQLPGSMQMARADAWQRTILSDQCQGF